MPAGKLLWKPEPAFARKTNIAAFMKWLSSKGLRFADYDELWRWSVDDLEGFWGSVWKYFDVSDADYPVLRDRRMPGAKWFDGSELNFAKRVLETKSEGAALLSRAERHSTRTLSWQELRKRSLSLAARLKGMGVEPGDRVAAYLPNAPEAVVAFLACATIGAVWSCCSPDFGAPAVLDRFSQIEPKVLFATNGYSYGGRWFDRSEAVASIASALPSVKTVVGVQGRSEGEPPRGSVPWDDLVAGKDSVDFESLPFDHPLWILYSSGTTGLPKPIVQGHGGILVEMLKGLALHNDLRPGDRFFWFTTTGWMMWNHLVGGLLHGATLVLYNGSPSFPEGDALWRGRPRPGTGSSRRCRPSCAIASRSC
jgi:acetoacetyl-CoA synthetase